MMDGEYIIVDTDRPKYKVLRSIFDSRQDIVSPYVGYLSATGIKIIINAFEHHNNLRLTFFRPSKNESERKFTQYNFQYQVSDRYGIVVCVDRRWNLSTIPIVLDSDHQLKWWELFLKEHNFHPEKIFEYYSLETLKYIYQQLIEPDPRDWTVPEYDSHVPAKNSWGNIDENQTDLSTSYNDDDDVGLYSSGDN